LLDGGKGLLESGEGARLISKLFVSRPIKEYGLDLTGPNPFLTPSKKLRGDLSVPMGTLISLWFLIAYS